MSKNIMVIVDDEIHSEFKSMCAKNGVSMHSVLEHRIKQFIHIQKTQKNLKKQWWTNDKAK